VFIERFMCNSPGATGAVAHDRAARVDNERNFVLCSGPLSTPALPTNLTNWVSQLSWEKDSPRYVDALDE